MPRLLRDHHDAGPAKPLGERELGTTEAVAQTLAIGPVVSVGFAAYLVAGTAGGAMTVTLALAFAGAAAMGWVVTVFARRHAGAGGLYEYLAAAGPSALAVGAGTAYFLVGLVTATAGVVGGIVTQGFATQHLGFDPGWVAPGLAILAFVGALTLRGVRLAARWVLAISVVGALPMLVLVLAALTGAGAQGPSLQPLDPAGGDVLRALPYAVLLFMGFEAACCLGEESRAPRRSIPRAIPWGIAASGVFYLVTSYAFTIGMGPDVVRERWGSDPLAIVGLADQLVGRPLGALVQLGILIDVIAFAIATTNLGARGWLALARDGLAPRVLEGVSRWGTPSAGTLTMVVSGLLLVLLGVALDDPLGVFEAAFTAGPLIVLGVYVVLCALAARVLAGEDGPAWRWVVLAVGAAVPLLGLHGSLDPWPVGAREIGLYLAVGLVALSTAWASWLRRRRPEVLPAVRARRAAPTPRG